MKSYWIKQLAAGTEKKGICLFTNCCGIYIKLNWKSSENTLRKWYKKFKNNAIAPFYLLCKDNSNIFWTKTLILLFSLRLFERRCTEALRQPPQVPSLVLSRIPTAAVRRLSAYFSVHVSWIVRNAWSVLFSTSFKWSQRTMQCGLVLYMTSFWSLVSHLQTMKDFNSCN